MYSSSGLDRRAIKHTPESWKILKAGDGKARSKTLVPESFPTYDLDADKFKDWLKKLYKVAEIDNFRV